jgi:hypothetical protein
MTENKDLAPLKANRLTSGLRLVSWNLVTDCNAGCRLWDKCSKKQDGEGCVIEKEYLEYIMQPIFKYLEDDLDEYDLVELGMKYIRLHHNLVRVQKEILGTDIISENKYGNIKVNPLLAEERNILQAIDSLEINRLLRKKVKTRVKEITSGVVMGSDKRSTVVEILDDSDTTYTDRLAGEQ